MDTPPRPKPAPSAKDTDGVGHLWSPSTGYLLIALLLAIGAISYVFFLLMSSLSSDEAGGVAATAPPPLVPTAASGVVLTAPQPALPPKLPERAIEGLTEGDADPTRDLKSYVARGEQPSMSEVITRLHQAGVHTGLGAFSPPGTRPPLVGLAVPEDFVLPKGYVRHHQATDDGQRIEAILMFAPDYQAFDAEHKAIALPKDRVVTPELAPPGLPIRRIIVPAPTQASKSGP